MDGGQTLPGEYLQWLIATYYQDYLNRRLTYLDIPSMMLLDERERHRMALDATANYASLSGFIPPQMSDYFKKVLGSAMSGDTGFDTNVDDATMDNVRGLLRNTGWGDGNDQEAINTFLNSPLAQQNPDLQSKLWKAQQYGPQMAMAGAQEASKGWMPSSSFQTKEDFLAGKQLEVP